MASHRPVARAQPQRVLGAVDGVPVRLMGERECQIGVSHRQVGVQFQGSAC